MSHARMNTRSAMRELAHDTPDNDNDSGGGSNAKTGTSDTRMASSSPLSSEHEDSDDEDALDRKMAIAERALRMKRKRDQLSLMEKQMREPPEAEKLDSQSDVRSNRTVTTEAASNLSTLMGFTQRSIVKAPMKSPAYDGTSYKKLRIFLREIQAIFQLDTISFSTDRSKVLYASCCLTDHAQDLWAIYATVDDEIDYDAHTWKGFVDWLRTQPMDSQTRSMRVMRELGKLKQRRGQSFHDFYVQWGTCVAEYPKDIDPELNISLFLESIRHGLRKQIVSREIPTTWNALKVAGERAEDATIYDDDDDDDEEWREDKRRKTGRGDSSLSEYERSGRGRDTTQRTPVVCYKCHKTGHIAAHCRAPDCQTCGSFRHSTERHEGNNEPEKRSDANTTPVNTVRR